MVALVGILPLLQASSVAPVHPEDVLPELPDSRALRDPQLLHDLLVHFRRHWTISLPFCLAAARLLMLRIRRPRLRGLFFDGRCPSCLAWSSCLSRLLVPLFRV